MGSKHMGIEQARKNLREIAEEVRRTGQPVTLTFGNSRTPVARITPLEDTMTWTTDYGTWKSEVDEYQTGPEDVARSYYGDNEPDNFEDILAAYRAAINTALPNGVTLTGSEFIGPAGEPEFPGYPAAEEDGFLDIGTIVRGVDFEAIVEQATPAAPVITADHIRELYDTHQTREPSATNHTDNMQPVLVQWEGSVEVMIEATALARNLRILYTAEQLTGWLDGTELEEGDAETIAAEATEEIRRRLR